MASSTNNGGARMNHYSNNPGPTATDEDQHKMIVIIVVSIFVPSILLLKLLCFCFEKDMEEEQDVGGGNGVREQGQSSRTGGWADDSSAPSSTVASAAAVEVAPVQAAEPPLVCTYRMADGWRDGSCGVCLAELADGDVLRVLPACMHYFHADCVGEWLRRHATCPLCRAPLVAPAAAA